MNSQAHSILHTNFHRGWGGQPARILMLSQDLARLGHRVVIAAPAGSILAGRARQAGLETFEEPRFLKTKHILSALRDAAALNGLLRSRRFDLVDAHGSQDLGASALARRRRNDHFVPEPRQVLGEHQDPGRLASPSAVEVGVEDREHLVIHRGKPSGPFGSAGNAML